MSHVDTPANLLAVADTLLTTAESGCWPQPDLWTCRMEGLTTAMCDYSLALSMHTSSTVCKFVCDVFVRTCSEGASNRLSCSGSSQ